MTTFLRFADLKDRGIVSNWVTLRNWIKKQGFPAGRMLGPNTRVWTEEEINAFLETRPAARAKPAPKRERNAKGTEESTTNA